jgi:hypothetical protein
MPRTQRLNIKRTNNSFNKWANELFRQFLEVQMANKCMVNILSYKGNAQQNNAEILSHPARMGILKEKSNNKKCW